MSFFCRVIELSDLQEILDFEAKKMQDNIPDEAERLFASWNSRHRPEALEHYIKIGWSFIARDKDAATKEQPEGPLAGYFIAQPLLFLDGQTQTLWVEHVQYSTLKARDELCELAYKLSREKHLQRVYFPKENGVANSITGFKPEVWQPGAFAVKTTK